MHLDLESKWEYRAYINVKYMISWNLNRDVPIKSDIDNPYIFQTPSVLLDRRAVPPSYVEQMK